MSSSLKRISHTELKTLLNTGSVKFYFRKVGGELRIASGTLDLDRVPQKDQPKGGKAPSGTTTYYDLEKGAWRSVSESQEVWVD